MVDAGAPEGPLPSRLKDRLRRRDATFLDVGTGVGGICVAMCQAFPHLACVGLDILPRALELAETELTDAAVRHRVQLREQNVRDLSDNDVVDVVELPLPPYAPEILVGRTTGASSSAGPGVVAG